MKKLKTITIICIMVFFSIGFLSIAEAQEYKQDSMMAYTIIQEFVKDRLENPTGAKFAQTGHGIAYSELGYYVIYAYVDTSVRTCFIGIVKQVSETTWMLTKLTLL